MLRATASGSPTTQTHCTKGQVINGHWVKSIQQHVLIYFTTALLVYQKDVQMHLRTFWAPGMSFTISVLLLIRFARH